MKNIPNRREDSILRFCFKFVPTLTFEYAKGLFGSTQKFTDHAPSQIVRKFKAHLQVSRKLTNPFFLRLKDLEKTMRQTNSVNILRTIQQKVDLIGKLYFCVVNK